MCSPTEADLLPASEFVLFSVQTKSCKIKLMPGNYAEWLCNRRENLRTLVVVAVLFLKKNHCITGSFVSMVDLTRKERTGAPFPLDSNKNQDQYAVHDRQ